MKNLLFILATAMLVLVPTEASAEKKKKEKKKKEVKWELPKKMSGIEDLDRYILTVDTLYNKVNSYTELINFYTQKTVPLMDVNGQQMTLNDQPLVKTEVTDREGNNVSILQLTTQLSDVLLSLSNLSLDITNAGLQTAIATTALASNPLLAFTYGKYIKNGPVVIGMAGTEIGRLVKTTTKQYKMLTQLRESQIEENENIDLSSIDSDKAIINTQADAEAAGAFDDFELGLGEEVAGL